MGVFGSFRFTGGVYVLISASLLYDAAVSLRAQDLCESRGGRPGLPVPNSLYGLRGRIKKY